ncbi:TRM11 family SAM-dependent methyltransferase [Rugosimonospora africana]|uniref:Methyltransferase n=1 Tax=Rugosimonospora africana TaxID=556532 RepID=A0A8J3VRG0_9ACTN|nr:DNA methyltransferase [Rugosimonospora africana]GIH16150.1 hypothetical protein Raf01_43220 [Rugosimonospora africana]
MASRVTRDQARVTGDAAAVAVTEAGRTTYVSHGTGAHSARRIHVTGDAADAGHQVTPTPNTTAERRSSVIVLSARSVRAQRAGRYVAGSGAHPARLTPDLAATLMRDYSQPGDLVLDPLAGTGTVLVEATHLGRNALGIADDPGWVALARANLAFAHRQGATGHARVLATDPTRLPAGIPNELHGQVTLVLTSPPPSRTMRVNGRQRPIMTRPATQRIQILDGLTATLAGCVPLLAPGGIVAVVTRPWYRDTTMTDLATQVVSAGQAADLTLVACRRAVHDMPTNAPIARSVEEIPALSDGRYDNHARVTVSHDDIAVFRADPTGGPT